MIIPRRMRGVSLVEQMTTVAVLAITLTFGVPTFQNLSVVAQRAQAPSALMASFALARSEAARRGAPVTLCASADGEHCDTAQNPGWQAGWILFIDVDQDKEFDSGTDQILDAVRFERPAFTLSAQCIVTPCSIAAGVSYRDTGYPAEGDTGRFVYRDDREYQVLTLGLIGRVEVTDSGAGAGPS